LSNIKLYIPLNQNGKITNRAALDEINKLIEFQLLKPKGKGKALHYKNGMCLFKYTKNIVKTLIYIKAIFNK